MKMKFAVLHKSDLNIVFPDDTYVFRIDATGFSEIFSSLYDLWRRIRLAISYRCFDVSPKYPMALTKASRATS